MQIFVCSAPSGSDRLGRLVSHLFCQQSFYPLNPPAEEMSVDLEHADDYCKLNFTPHLLLVPSDLRFFIKVKSYSTLVLLQVI